MSPPSQQSAFLQCLASLDVDTWAQVLLPMLIKQRTARDVALTCSHLRDLCYSAVQHLNLSTLHPCGNVSGVEAMVKGVPQHFSNCTSVQLLLRGDTSFHTTPYLLPALAKLPKLNLIKLRVENILNPLLMGTVLYSLRAQLPQTVRALSLDLQQSWFRAGQAWTELARLTALTKLTITFGHKVTLAEQDLLPFSNLQSLQDLAISTLNDTYVEPLLSAQVAAGMTSLTSLDLSGCHVSCIRHVGSSRALRKLTMSCPATSQQELGAHEWAAVGKLTRLKQLHLLNAEVCSASPEFCAAVSELVQLQSIGAGLLSGDVVSALTVCTGLTELVGCWQQGSGAEEGVTLPSVTRLRGIGGVPPFSAFPNLATVLQSGALSASVFVHMVQYCAGLQKLQVCSKLISSTTFPTSEPASVRVAALKGLVGLQHLVQLDFMVQDDAEVLALADTAGALLPHLEWVRIFDWTWRPLQPGMRGGSPFVTLGKVRGLAKLRVELTGAVALQVALDAYNFLSAVSGVSRVYLFVDEEYMHIFLVAQDALQRLGLSCPKYLSVQQCMHRTIS